MERLMAAENILDSFLYLLCLSTADLIVTYKIIHPRFRIQLLLKIHTRLKGTERIFCKKSFF